jgi:hypothetical protein
MPRPLRREYAGAICPVLNRVDRQKSVVQISLFHEPRGREREFAADFP